MTAGKMVSTRPCQLYRHFDADGRLLYVGISHSVMGRTSQHRDLAPWFERVATITVDHFPSRAKAAEAEARAISDEAPLFNVALSPASGREPKRLAFKRPEPPKYATSEADIARSEAAYERAMALCTKPPKRKGAVVA